MAAKEKNARRRFPRRRFTQKVGMLFRGEYQISESVQIGEGGMLVRTSFSLLEESCLVISFLVPGRDFIIARSQVQYIMSVPETREALYGLKFLNITFDHRRKLRDFIAAKTEEEAQADGVFSRL